MHARWYPQRYHPEDSGVVRALHRLRHHQDPPLRVREVPRVGARPDDADEVRRRGDGRRPHVAGVLQQGASLPGDWPERLGSQRQGRRYARRRRGAEEGAHRPEPRARRRNPRGVHVWHDRGRDPQAHGLRPVVPSPDGGPVPDRELAQGPLWRVRPRQAGLARSEAPRFQRHPDCARAQDHGGRGAQGAPRARCARVHEARRHVRRGVRG
mmetsp:Transcript_15474/g.65292  ORF Transcript_15474/g.65292 Transcript_15474/m.65292 type:complete len:211 (-) Transcript_15474:2567-3199(-)